MRKNNIRRDTRRIFLRRRTKDKIDVHFYTYLVNTYTCGIVFVPRI